MQACELTNDPRPSFQVDFTAFYNKETGVLNILCCTVKISKIAF